MDMALARRSGQELRNSYIVTKSTEHAALKRFFKAAVDGLQLVFDRSIVTSVQPKSLLTQMREEVADCDDGSSDGSLMLLWRFRCLRCISGKYRRHHIFRYDVVVAI